MGKTSRANKRVPGVAHRQHWHIGAHDSFLVAPSNRHCKHSPSSSGRDFFKALEQGRPFYLLVYALLILLFVFFFTAIVVNKNQRSSYPAREAAKLDAVLTRLTLLGALYLAILCIVPELMINFFAIPFYLGGTSLLLTVLVGLDTLARVSGPSPKAPGVNEYEHSTLPI